MLSRQLNYSPAATEIPIVAKTMAIDLQASRIFDNRTEEVKAAFNALGREMDRWPTVSNLLKKLKYASPPSHRDFPKEVIEQVSTAATAEKAVANMRDKGWLDIPKIEIISDDDEKVIQAELEAHYQSIKEKKA